MKQFTQKESAFKKQTAFMILENKIENLTNEYLFFECLTENERVPSKAFGTLWKTITENLPALKKDMTNRGLFVKNDGVYLKQAYKIKEARRKYIFDKIIFFLYPAAVGSSKPLSYLPIPDYQLFTKKEKEDIKAIVLLFEKFFLIKSKLGLAVAPNVKKLNMHLSYSASISIPLANILSRIWHGTLKTGDKLNKFFIHKSIAPEIIRSFHGLPLPCLFGIKGKKIILNHPTRELFLFTLASLVLSFFSNRQTAQILHTKTFFMLYEISDFEELLL